MKNTEEDFRILQFHTIRRIKGKRIKMFTPEKEAPTSRFRESTPKTPLFKKKEEDELTPLDINEAKDKLTDLKKTISRLIISADDHLHSARVQQSRVIDAVKTAYNHAKEYELREEKRNLKMQLKKEIVKRNQIVELMSFTESYVSKSIVDLF